MLPDAASFTDPSGRNVGINVGIPWMCTAKYFDLPAKAGRHLIQLDQSEFVIQAIGDVSHKGSFVRHVDAR
jgi:hypothetical protein